MYVAWNKPVYDINYITECDRSKGPEINLVGQGKMTHLTCSYIWLHVAKAYQACE
jgi:hypothetical protein